MTNLMQKLQASTTVKYSSSLDQSEIFQNAFHAPTLVPALNVALSGELAGGLTCGVTMWAGPSKHFKTLFAMICAKAYLDKYKDAIILFYDTEFGAGLQYFKNVGIDSTRVLHTPIADIEEMKHDILVQLKNIDRGDRVCILVDSFGNMASKKEVDDSTEGKVVTDMSRAKAMKSLFRMVTGRLVIKDIPLVCVNHTYKTMEMFSKDVVSGGTGAVYNSNQVFILGRQQEKGGEGNKELMGYNFIINVDKSRWVKEKSKIPINVTWDKGVNTWSGLLEMALDSGHVQNPKKGKFNRKGSSKLYSSDETNTKDFWTPILTDDTFKAYIEDKYTLKNEQLLSTEMTDDDIAQEYEEAETPAPKKAKTVAAPTTLEELKARKPTKVPRKGKKARA